MLPKLNLHMRLVNVSLIFECNYIIKYITNAIIREYDASCLLKLLAQ